VWNRCAELVSSTGRGGLASYFKRPIGHVGSENERYNLEAAIKISHFQPRIHYLGAKMAAEAMEAMAIFQKMSLSEPESWL